MLDVLLTPMAQLLWPARCTACAAIVPPAVAFCDVCVASVLPLGEVCQGCALPRAADRCATCPSLGFSFATVRAVFSYGGAVATALLRLKHGRLRHVGPPLGAFLGPIFDETAARGGGLVVPVPLHPRRLRARGFNQSLELARAGLRARGRRRGAGILELALGALERRVDTPPLGREAPSARRQRVSGGFSVPRPAVLAGRDVLLVDDVLTTGATATECARTLLAAGARSVSVAALARAL